MIADTTISPEELSDLESGPQSLTWKNGVRRGLHDHIRFAAFLDRESGTLAGEGGGVLSLSPQAPLSELLTVVALMPAGRRPRTVYLTGPDLASNRPPLRWYREPVAAGWSMTRPSGDHSADYRRGELRVSVRMAHEWFDDESDARTCAASWAALRCLLRATFGDGAYLYPNPTQTGLYLLQLSLPFGREYPVLPDGLREHLYHTNTQGRWELIEMPGRETLPQLLALDGRWMYAACVSQQLPAGPWIYDAEDCFGGYVPGFYRVRARVPAHWDRVGLLGLRDGDETVYPRTPGTEFTTWTTGAELPLAIKHGWITRYERRILWPQAEQHGNPMRRFAEKLKTLRSAAETHGEANLRAAYRNILLRAVGALHSHESREEGYCALSSEIPNGVTWAGQVEGGIYRWERRYPSVSESSHPEWSAQVWGRTRARVAKAALQIPLDELVAIRTDALWVTRDPGWPDNGTPGAWRVKETIDEPVAQPHTADEMLTLLQLARGRE